jgi:NADH-quinone oxidoreductase subunit C
VPKLTSAELKARLARDLPAALAPAFLAESQDGNGVAPNPHHVPGPLGALETEDALVLPTQIAALARYLRDTLGYTYLSNITAVDYLDAGIIELVYHFYTLEGGPPLVVKARLPREAAELPSLTPEWPGADLQEREAFDLFGVRFLGHPFLRRVYMWDEFEGFPMRKDFPKIGDKYLAEGGEDE